MCIQLQKEIYQRGLHDPRQVSTQKLSAGRAPGKLQAAQFKDLEASEQKGPMRQRRAETEGLEIPCMAAGGTMYLKAKEYRV